MARVRYYTETLEDCVVVDRNDYCNMQYHLTRGVWFGFGKGHRKKSEAIDYCKRVNQAAGREVVRYFGPLDESGCGLQVVNLKKQ